MPVDVEAAADPIGGDRLAAAVVTTPDATGTERRYVVSLTDDTIGGGHVLAGRRIHPEPGDDEHCPVGPTEQAWSAAAEHFREQGYEVWNR